jgi:hypothetical protein
MSAGTRWLRAAVALSEEHVRTQRVAGLGPAVGRQSVQRVGPATEFPR